MEFLKKNTFTQTFRHFDSNLEDLAKLESLLAIFEEVVSSKVFVKTSRPVFKYHSTPSSSLLKDIGDFLKYFQADSSFIETLSLDCKATVVITKREKLRVSIDLKDHLSDEVEARLLQTKKTLSAITLVYSRQNKRIGLSTEKGKLLETKEPSISRGKEAMDA